jgi:hypothetical protein
MLKLAVFVYISKPTPNTVNYLQLRRMVSDMDIEIFAKRLQEKFEERMEAKNGWGKNEIKNEFQIALSLTLLEIIKDTK